MGKSLVFLVLVFLAANSLFVEELLDRDMESIQTSKKVWLLYEADHVTDADQAVLDEVGEVLNGFFRVGFRSGVNDDQGIKVYGDDGIVVKFDGELNAEALVKFVLDSTNDILEARSAVAKEMKANEEYIQKQIQRAQKEWEGEQQLRVKTNTILLDAASWEANFLKSREPYFVNFYEANCSDCISLNAEWEAISTELKGRAKVAKLNITEEGNEALEEQIKLENYPSVRFYPVGNKNVDEFSEFTGIRKKFSILEWANSKLSEKKQTVNIPELNKENYETLCKGTKSTCVILFVEDPSEIAASVGQLAAKYLEKPITFLVSKKGSQPAFEGQVEVTSAPETVMMYCKMKKFYKMGGMDFKSIDDTINQITLGNRNGFIKYKFAEEMV